MARTTNFVSAQMLRENLHHFYEKPVTKVSLELMLSMFTVIFFAVFALRPTINTMARLIQEIDEKTVVDQQLSIKIASLSTAQSEYLAFQDRFPVLETAIHQDLSLENALLYLEYLVIESEADLVGLQIRNFPVSLPDPNGDTPAAGASNDQLAQREVGIYTTQITFTGDMEGIRRFFQSMENMRPLLAVNGFSASLRDQRGEGTVITVSATLLMYGYQPRPRPAARPGAPTPADDALIEGLE